MHHKLEWTLEENEASALRDFIGDDTEATMITLKVGWIKGGEDDLPDAYGLIAYCTEYPEEGAILLYEMTPPKGVTDERCPKCLDPNLIRYSTLNFQQCSYCGTKLPWDLKPNQQPIVSSSRDRRKPRSKS